MSLVWLLGCFAVLASTYNYRIFKREEDVLLKAVSSHPFAVPGKGFVGESRGISEANTAYATL